MRIVHFADVHIGVESYGSVDPETGLSSRLGDFLRSLDEVVDYAIESHADLALFCGDAYKSRDPSQTHQREFAKRIARLSEAGVPVFLVEGNHDIPNVLSRATALDIFRTLRVPNVHIGSTVDVQTVATPSGPLQVLAVPWVRRGAFLSREDARGLNPDQVTEAIQERLTAAIRLRAEQLDPNVPAVLAGHVAISEAKLGSEQSMMLGRDHVLLRSSVALPQLDYVALGHVHRQQILGRDPLVVYSGALERVDFGEEKDEKGFYVVELDPGKPAGSRLRYFQFQPVNARAMLTVAVEVEPGDTDPTATVVKAIARHHVEDAIVRVRIRVPGALEGHLRDADIRQALESAHYVAAVSKEVIEVARARLGQPYSQSLSPQVALKAYLEAKNVAQDRSELLMRRAQELFQEDALPQ